MTGPHDIQKIYFPSNTAPYLVDLRKKSCTCALFLDGEWCPHLKAVGQYPERHVTLSARPSFSQALSGLVKSIRLRDIDEAAYWLTYCWGFREKLNGAQFRIVRRLLIGAAEDGHSVVVMEKLADNFGPLLSKNVEFARVMAELVRICKVPNWWHPDSGGHDYIYHGMLGTRLRVYDTTKYTPPESLHNLGQAIADHDKAATLRWVFEGLSNDHGGPVIAANLLDLASTYDCSHASRLITNVYLRHQKALNGDENFLCQAAWNLAGGESPVADHIEVVTKGEVMALIDKVNATEPHVIPGWCCDGVHCAGNDIRYAGMWDRMHAVCNQYSRYRRVNPNDPWLESEFYKLDGLKVEEA